MSRRTDKTSHHEAEAEAPQWMEYERRWIFPPRKLNFIWGNDPRYWVIPKEDGKPAELKNVSWLEVTGSVNIDTGKKYEIGFKVSFKPDSVGWDQAPVFISAKIGNGKAIWKRIKSINHNSQRGESISIIPSKTDGQFEISSPPPGSQDTKMTKLQFGLYEVWTGKWKSGLMIHEAFVREVTSEDVLPPPAP